MFGNLLNIAEAPPELRQMILAKTGGNPLFVEEFIRMLIDTDAVTQDESGTHWRAGTKIEELPLPENLRALLTARIDRLGDDARRTLQLSSVIGRSFHHGVIKRISDATIALDSQLSTLQRAELIREAARIPELEYIFRHDLTREAAYNSILLRERRDYHGRVGEAVEGIFKDRLEEQSHLLAHHFYQAGDTQKALTYSVMAGEAAARLYANDEASTHYTRAIELARQGDSSNQQIIDLYISRGRAQEVSGLCDDALSGYEELEELGRERKDAALELAALTASPTLHSTINALPDIEKARALSERSLDLAQQLKDHGSEARVLWNHMLIEILAGDDYYKALEFGEQSLRIARQYNLREQIAYTLQDIARAYFAIGQFTNGRAAMEEARESWRTFDNKPMLADNLVTSALALHAAGLFAEADELVEEALDLSGSIGSLYLEAFALGANAQGHVERGDIDQALVAIEAGIAKAVAANNESLSSLLRATSAAVYGLLGASDRGLEQALIALDLANEWQRRAFLTPLALAHLCNGHLPEAEAALQPWYEDSRMESKRNMEYIGVISALPNLIRIELALAMQDYDRVLTYAGDF